MRSNASKRPSGIQSATGGDLRHKAGFIAEFGPRRTRGDFHALYGAGGKLRGEKLALLIADRLVVNKEGGLCMISQGMKKAIAVGRHSAGAVNDRLAQTARPIELRKLVDHGAIGIDLGGGAQLADVRGSGFNRDGLLLAGHRELICKGREFLTSMSSAKGAEPGAVTSR